MREHPEGGLAHAIRAYRREAGISQAELANRAGFSREYVSRAERPSAGLASHELVSAIDAGLGAGGRLTALRARLFAGRVERRREAGATPAATPQAPATSDHTHPVADTDGAVLDPAEPAAELARIQQTGDQAGPSRILSSTVALMIRIEEALDSSRGADRSLLLRSGAQVAEFAGFVCRDAGQDVECASWHARALEYALRADDSAIQAYVLLRKAQAVYDRRATHLMSDLVAAAERAGTGAGPGLRAEILQQRARCEAMLGARSGDVRRMLDRAAAVAAEQPDRNDPALQHDEALFGIQIAICLCEAGRPRDAFHQYRSVDTRSLSQRDQAYVSILTARALALSGEPDEAAVMAQQSVPIAAAAGSRRSLGEARRLARTLEPWRSRHAVQDLGHVLRSASELLHR